MACTMRTESYEFLPQPLTEENFGPFGTVIQGASSRRADAVSANQGSALKIPAICPSVNMYDLAPSRVTAQATTSMFICSPRELRRNQGTEKRVFDVKVLERHPYSTQTFVPLGLDASIDSDTCYLVIVCPSLPLPTAPSADGGNSGSWSEEFKSAGQTSSALFKGPDLAHMRAFVARGSQGVTYGVGTWHAPMVVLGKKAVEFVVFQFSNQVPHEDCEEVHILPNEGQESAVSVLCDAAEGTLKAMI